MQSRRREDLMVQSPVGKLRDRRIELGPDPYAMPRRDVLERSPRSRRSLSPHNQEGLRRGLDGDRRSTSLGRRSYGWDLDGGRVDRMRSRSPPFGQLHNRPHYDGGISARDLLPVESQHKRPHYDEGVSRRDLLPVESQRSHEYFDYKDMNADANRGPKHEYGYEYSTSRIMREKDIDGGRFPDAVRQGMLGQKSMLLEDSTARESFRLITDFGPTSKYVEGGGNFTSSSAHLDLGHFMDEKVRYQDPSLQDKSSVMEPYGKGEKPMFHSRNVTYPAVPQSQSKDYMATFKDFGGTSSGISRANFTNEYQRSSAKLTEPLGSGGYGQRFVFDSVRDQEAEHKDLTGYRRDTFSPTKTRAEQWDYLYTRPGRRESDERGYPSDDLYRRMASSEQADYHHRDLLRPSTMDSVAEHVDNTECSHRNLRDGSLWDQPSMQRQTVPDFLGMSRSLIESKQGGEYVDSGTSYVEFGRRMLNEEKMSHLDVSVDNKNLHLRLDYGFGSDAGPASYKESTRSALKYEAEMHRRAGRIHRTNADEHITYDPSDRVLKRKYSMDEEMSRHNTRGIMSSKWNNSSRMQELHDRDEDLMGEDVSASFSSRRGHGHNPYRRVERSFDRADRHGVSGSDEWLSSHDRVREHSTKHYKPGGRYLKDPPRPGPLSWHNSHRSNRRHVFPKQHNVWIRSRDGDQADDNQVDVHANEVDQAEDWMSYAKSEPPEDSEEFNQLVGKAFLSFTKKLNENPAVRKRYKEQGRAGSLYCIVCGRSLSKEFMDTQRLVTHAYMSLKVGLRAQHLGLQKALCVLMGWNSSVAPDVITWAPESISSDEALAQKEDLILWPPAIVIHNISISDNDPKGRKVISIDALGDFLRGKGFGGGKIKVCLGKPANHSILVVKFLGTFSGLQDAERLHNYFAEKRRGRIDLEQIASSKGKSSNGGDEEKQASNMEDLVLYGYMGIAEDLDKVDSDTKRKCLIKSKKEIQDLANAPVKPQ
ncbi:uncharacterized protein LOC132311856 [Cornus florida]|uniref:uncharacterized protein LOC132311856 n=1 Tax=Cornus florida TaxID=4283 RepID=UPI0028998735|nr:uncharacterized protein LOC132311856 [Cornus florida]